MADYPSAFVSSDVASDGIKVGVSDLLKLCRVKDPDTQKRRIENIRRYRERGMNEHPPGHKRLHEAAFYRMNILLRYSRVTSLSLVILPRSTVKLVTGVEIDFSTPPSKV